MSSVFSPDLFVGAREAAPSSRMPHPLNTARSNRCHLAGKKGAVGTCRLPEDFDPVIDTATLLSGPLAKLGTHTCFCALCFALLITTRASKLECN